MHYLFGILLTLTSLFLILLILVQRGRGGGLSGALGGMGGQSAFGAKAGDTFTYVTIGVAAFWILLSILAIMMLSASTGPLGRPTDLSPITETLDGDVGAGTGESALPPANPFEPGTDGADAATGNESSGAGAAAGTPADPAGSGNTAAGDP